MDVKATLHPCAHCERTGTCSRAANGASCAACVKNSAIKGSGHVGLPCGICGGLGHAEAKTERINKRVQPLLAVVTLYLLMAAIFASAATKSPYFSEILAFASPLIGVVLAFYFTTRSSSRT